MREESNAVPPGVPLMLPGMDSRKLITIVIDSNAIWRDWSLEWPVWDALQILAEHGLIEVSVPEVVVQEVIRGHKGEVNDLVAALRKLGLWKLEKLLDLDVPSSVKDVKEGADTRIAEYEATLRERLAELSIKVPPVPAVDQQTMLTRALESRKPFDGEGKNGFRDALIWHTVLEVCRAAATNTKVVFITANTSDFCVKATGKLHDDLQREVTATGSAPLEIVRNLTDAMQHLKDVEELDAEFAPDGLPVVTPSPERINEIATEACGKLVGREIQTTEPIESWETTFSDFRTVIENDATLADVRPDLATLDWKIDGRDFSGRPTIEMSLNAEISLEGMAYKADYYADDTGSIDVWDGDWNDHYMWLVTHHVGRLSLLVYLTPDGMRIDEIELHGATEVMPEPTPEPQGRLIAVAGAFEQ